MYRIFSYATPRQVGNLSIPFLYYMNNYSYCSAQKIFSSDLLSSTTRLCKLPYTLNCIIFSLLKEEISFYICREICTIIIQFLAGYVKDLPLCEFTITIPALTRTSAARFCTDNTCSFNNNAENATPNTGIEKL